MSWAQCFQVKGIHKSYNWRYFLNFSMLYLKWTLEIRNLMGSEVKSLCGWRPTVGLVRLDWAEPSVSKSEGFIKQQQTCMFCRCGPRKIPPTPTQATLHSWPCPCLECLVHHADESIINQLWPTHRGLCLLANLFEKIWFYRVDNHLIANIPDYS